jgi:WD40-like Beta Propeller Repeat
MASVPPAVSQTASPTSSATATPQVFATIVPSYVESFVPAQTRGVGQLAGDWVFMLRRSTLMGSRPHAPGVETIAPMDRAVDTLTLVPIAGPETRTVSVVTFLSNLGDGIVATNLLNAQFSPDGDRLVLSVGTRGPQGGVRLGLVIIELTSGNMFDLTTDPSYHDDTPAWSPDGSWIAFSRRTVRDGRDAAVWIIAATPGSQPRALMSQQVDGPRRRTHIYGWTPDGRLIGMTRGHDDVEFWDASFTGVCAPGAAVCGPPPMTSFNGVVAGSRAAIDWRVKTPQFVGAFAEQPNGSVAPSIAIADGPSTLLRTVAKATESPSGSLLRPRWRPGSDEVLYLASPAPRTGDHKLMIIDTTSGASRLLLERPFPMQAEWTPDGSGIAWVEAASVGFAVRVVNVEGSGERVIHSGGGVPEGDFNIVDFGTVRF